MGRNKDSIYRSFPPSGKNKMVYLVINFETEVLREIVILDLVRRHLGEPEQDMHLVHHHPIGLDFPPIVDSVGLVLSQVEGQVLLLCFLFRIHG